MPFDIKKITRTPVQRFERPQAFRQIPHVRRYFGRLANQSFSVLFLLAATLTPLALFDFGASAGTGRVALWFALMGLAAVVVAFSVAYLTRSIAYRPRALHAALAALPVVAALSAVFGLDPARSFSFSSFSVAPLVPAIAIGAFAAFAAANLANEPRFLKLLLVGHLLGSTVAALAVLARFFTGGYGGILWVESQSWLAVFTVNVFLLLIFAMLQKGAAKTVWTVGLLLHLAVLFLFDNPAAWAVLLVSASALVAFQALYAKKLWQRNFIYPLEIAAVSLLLLITPVKMFTGASVPEIPVYDARSVTAAFRSLGERAALGVGPALSDRAMLTSGIASFFDLSEQGLPVEAKESVPQSGLHILLENGVLGLAAWVVLFALFFAEGWRFLKKHLASIKEETVSESVYLAVMTLVSVALLAALLAFFPWALPPFWFLMLLIGISLGFMHPASPANTPAETATRRFESGRRLAIASAVAAVLAVCYVVLVVSSVKTLAASRAALAARRTENAEEALALWQKAASYLPGEERYRARAARAEIATLTEGTPLDVQRDILERVNAALLAARAESRDPLVHWLAAEAYTELESVAEGSLLLAREAYTEAAERAPGNLPLAAAIARFYRTNMGRLSSNALSATSLYAEAREHLARTLKLVPEYLPARLELALIIEVTDGVPPAIAELAPWEEASPEIRYEMGRLYLNDGALDEAVDRLEAVVAEVPNHSNAYYSLGVAYYRAGRYQDALATFERLLAMQEGSADVQEKIRQVKEKL